MIVQYEKQFEKNFKPLSPRVKERFLERLDLFKIDKFHTLLHNHPLDGEYKGYRSINITADYRAIFFEEGDRVTFVRIGTHSQIYK